MLTFNLILFASSVLLLWCVRHWHIHIHVTYSRRGATGKAVAPRSMIRRVKPGPSPSGKADEGPGKVNVLEDLTSALMGLGCDRVKAKRIASRVSVQRGDFDALLRAAIKEAA